MDAATAKGRAPSLRWQIAAGQAVGVCVVLAVLASALVWGLNRLLLDELDHHLHRDLEAAQAALAWRDGRFEWRETEHPEGDDFDSEPALEAWTAQGQRLFQRLPTQPGQTAPQAAAVVASEAATAAARWPPPLAAALAAPGPLYRSLHAGGEPLREGLEWRRVAGHSEPLRLRVLRPQAPMQAQLRRWALGIAVATLLAALCAALASAWWVRRSLQPLAALAARMQGIAHRGLPGLAAPAAAAAPAQALHELRELSAAFEAMRERLAQSHALVDGFAADCAHTLRTPLTALRLRAEQQWQGLPAGPGREALAEVLESTDHMAVLVQRLLLLARAGHAQAATAPRPVALLPLMRQTLETLRPLAGDVPLHLHEGEDPQLQVWADAPSLAQVLQDLVDNALRHAAAPMASAPAQAPAPVELRVQASDRAGEVELTISDRGPGVPAAVLRSLGLHGAEAVAGEAEMAATDGLDGADASALLRQGAAAGVAVGAAPQGSRLGLRIAQRLLAAMDGRLDVRGRAGGGAVLVLSLRRVSPGLGELGPSSAVVDNDSHLH
jgi:signal transduction histidine kinase